jgi:hypothetical protein
MGDRRRVRFSQHAITESMPEREVTVADVLAALAAPDYELLTGVS